MRKELILVLDFGSIYTQLIAQRVRENHVFSRIVPHNISAKEIKLLKPKGIIFSGGSSAAYNKKNFLPEKSILNLNIPVLGICFGARAILQHLGGRLKSGKAQELQRCELFIDDSRNIFSQMPGNITALTGNADLVKKLPAGFRKISHTQENPIAAFSNTNKKIFGLFFHPEVVFTQRGSQVIGNFLYKVCGCIGTWTMDAFIRETTQTLKKTVGKKKIILNLNGDLNSSVTAILIHRAVGKKLKCVFIDTGLLRAHEARQIKKLFMYNFNINIVCLNKSQRFLTDLKGVKSAPDKRKIIISLSKKLFEEQSKKSKDIEFAGEGTLYSEIIKSVQTANKAPGLKLLEPLKDLFKEEIRVIAKELGLPDNIVFRQPFPEPGLALRISGEVTSSRLKTLREVDTCLVEEIKQAGIYEQV